jgi:hypothetical protein
MTLSDVLAYHQRNAATAAARKARYEADPGTFPVWSRAQALTAEYQRRKHQEMADAIAAAIEEIESHA